MLEVISLSILSVGVFLVVIGIHISDESTTLASRYFPNAVRVKGLWLVLYGALFTGLGSVTMIVTFALSYL